VHVFDAGGKDCQDGEKIIKADDSDSFFPMKPVLRAPLFFLMGFLALRPTPSGAIPWVERGGLTATSLQTEFNFWTGAPHRMRLTRLCGSESAGAARFTAIFEQSPLTTPWAAQAGMTAAQFTAAHNDRHADGFRLVWLDGFGVGGEARYNGIWEKNGGTSQRVRLGESLSAHQSADGTNQAAGYSLADVSSFSVNGAPLHAGVWAQGVVPATEMRYVLSSAQYQSAFTDLGGQGWRLWRASGYESGSLERFTGVWRRTSLGEGWSRHGMSSADFNAHHLNAQHLGYRLACIDPYSVNGTLKYNATWVRNGGLSTARLGAIDAFVRDYMADRNLPGLSLALMREGRLVFARGYGWADTAAGDLADPLHRWRIASVSKPVCAVSALRALEDSPAWDLDDTAFGTNGLFGTDYGNTTLFPYNTRERAITLRQLLNMTAGWDSQGKLWYNDEPGYGENHAQIIGYQLDNVNPTRDPGTFYLYNNINYQVAARIPEKLSGKTFEAYTEEHVFNPSGITSMAMGGRTAASRLPNEVAYYPGNTWGSPENVWPARMDGSTAWVAKPSDLLLMARRIDGHPRHRDILTPASVNAMRLAGNQPDSNGNLSTYGLGWYPSTRHGLTWWQHNGAMAGSQALLCISQDGSQGLAYATNSVHTNDTFSGAFRDGVLDLMDGIEDADAWPAIDLFGKFNPAYDAWATDAFGSAITHRPGLAEVWAPAADPDGDDRCNGLEAFLGSDPTTPDRPNWASTRVTDTHLILRWTRRLGSRGVEATPEWTVSMGAWVSAGAQIVTRNDLFAPLLSVIQEAQVPRAALFGGGLNRSMFLRLRLSTP